MPFTGACATVAGAQPEPLLVVVLGPTASGKTALSLALAERPGIHGEIVNCDSVAMYREFDIGTAKPTASRNAPVRRIICWIASPRQTQVTAGEYARLGAARCSRKSKHAGICQSSWAELDFICGRCLKDSFPGRSARRNCASDCGNEPAAEGRIIFTAFCAVLIALRRRQFMRMMSPR